jgi:uncharacterized zinc-type alcohol dehydrogenase-like protein
MSALSVLGYAAKAVGQPLEPFEYLPPKLGEHDVRVSVAQCGVCHTDIHAVDNYYGITTYPFVPGHEIVGHVSALGSAVSGIKEGDRVGIGWQGRACMKCEWCLKGEEQLCMDIVPSATWVPYGGFSSSVVADSRFAYQLPSGVPSQVAAVLMCAGVTVYSPLRAYAAERTQKVAIVGVGGLGHLAIQFAHALGCDVTAISATPEKKDEALAFGADRFIDSNDQTSLRQVEFGFDLLMCTASAGMNWEALLMTLKKRGRLVLLGFFLGNRATMREMLAFAQTHGIAPEVELMPMPQVNDAFRRLKENKARYRIVLVNESARGAHRRD